MDVIGVIDLGIGYKTELVGEWNNPLWRDAVLARSLSRVLLPHSNVAAHIRLGRLLAPMRESGVACMYLVAIHQ